MGESVGETESVSESESKARAREEPYRGTSLIRNRRPLGPYSRTMPRALWGSWGGGRFRMSKVPLYQKLKLSHSIDSRYHL